MHCQLGIRELCVLKALCLLHVVYSTRHTVYSTRISLDLHSSNFSLGSSIILENVERAAGEAQAANPALAPDPVKTMRSLARQRLNNLPKVGNWRCPRGARWTNNARFTQASLLDISPNSDKNEIKALMREAQVTGQVVLLRPDPIMKARTPGFNEFIRDSGDFHLAHEDELDAFTVYDAKSKSWAGMRSISDVELKKLKEVLGDLKLKSYAQAVQAGKLGTSLLQNPSVKNVSSLGQAFLHFSVGESLVRNVSLLLPYHKDDDPEKAPHQTLLKRLEMSGHFDALGQYPLHPGDFAEYAQFFIQGAGNLGAAHIDDDAGATYFYLRVLEGHKRMRIWPIFEEKTLDDWQCAQKQWDFDKVDSTLAYKAFSFERHTWTPKGFEWEHETEKELNCLNNQPLAESRASNREQRAESRDQSAPGSNVSMISLSEVRHHSLDNDDHDATTEAQQQYTCHLELDLHTADEIFVASGIPHQVSTLAPTIAVTANYRFDTEGYDAVDETVDRAYLRKLMHDFPSRRKRMTAIDPEAEKTVQSVLRNAEEHISLEGNKPSVPDLARDITLANDFTSDPWKEYWNKGHRALAHPFHVPEKDVDLVKDVLLGT